MIEEECVKCGNNHADIKYFGNKTSVTETTSLADSIKVVSHTHLSDKEVLELTCSKCKYVWLEKPLDAIKEKEIKDEE